MMKKVRVGDVVWLRANKQEGWSRERVKIVEVEKRGVLLVELVKHGRDEDGLLEITADQIEP